MRLQNLRHVVKLPRSHLRNVHGVSMKNVKDFHTNHAKAGQLGPGTHLVIEGTSW